jgi:hypothetical protein
MSLAQEIIINVWMDCGNMRISFHMDYNFVINIRGEQQN